MTAFLLLANRVFDPYIIATRMNTKNFTHAPKRPNMLVGFNKDVLQLNWLAKFNISRSSVTLCNSFLSRDYIVLCIIVISAHEIV